MLTGAVKVMGLTSPRWISLKKASDTAARVSSAWEEGTAKQMECSLLAWAIITTFTAAGDRRGGEQGVTRIKTERASKVHELSSTQ